MTGTRGARNHEKSKNSPAVIGVRGAPGCTGDRTATRPTNSVSHSSTIAMKRIFNYVASGLAAAVLLVLMPGCDLANTEDSVEEAELEFAATLVADALGEQTEGMYADLYDATADVSPQGMTYRHRHQHGNDRPNRGAMHDYEASYDPSTGFHTVEYERNIATTRFTKTMTALLKFRYTTQEDTWVEFPEEDQASIDMIEYEGRRTGETVMDGMMRMAREQQFERNAKWTLSGILSGDGMLSLTGEQVRTGHHRVSTASGRQMERNFSMRIWTDDVAIDHDLALEEGLEGAVTGTLLYEMNIERSVNGGDPEVKSLEGTIDLASDGTAILRFQDLRRAFVINLESADIAAR